MRITPLCVAVLLFACPQREHTNPGAQATATPPKETAVKWSEPVDGIRTRIELPRAPARAGDNVAVTLIVENTSAEPKRIYFIKEEPFRGMLSDLWLLGADGKAIGSPQPEPQAHGYLPDENDFPLLAPKAQQRFMQTLRVDSKVAPGPLTVVWKLSNKLSRFPGGRLTLDGTSKPLFDGGDIPHIWLGEVSSRASLEISP